nr:aminopeptidase N-like [Penaeus vannamei]
MLPLFPYSSLSPNHWSEVLCTGVSAGGEKEWELVWNEYLNSNTTQERTSFLTALACSENATILSRYLEMSFNPDMGFRKDNFKIIFSAVANNIVGRQIAWTFLKKHWNDILRCKSQKFVFSNQETQRYLLNKITHSFNTHRDLADLQAFLQDRNTDLTEVARTAEQVLERTKNNVMWMEANVPRLLSFWKIMVMHLQRPFEAGRGMLFESFAIVYRNLFQFTGEKNKQHYDLFLL